MQRQTMSPFSFPPERNPNDSDDIELVNANEFGKSALADDPISDEPVSPETPRCYAFEYAAMPFIAVTEAVRESIDEANVYINPESTCERLANLGEYFNSVIAAPIAYASAAAVSVCGFFSGGARDIYNLAADCSSAYQQDQEDNTTCSAKTQP